MKSMRLLPALLILLIAVAGIVSFQNCFASNPDTRNGRDAAGQDGACMTVTGPQGMDDDTCDDDTGHVSSCEPVQIPDFVRRLLAHAEWSADTMSVANGTAYYWGYEEYARCAVLFSQDEILVATPVLQTDSFAPECDTKFYFSNAAKSVLVDFADRKTFDRLKALSQTLPSFTRYRKDSLAGFGWFVLNSFSIDFPGASVPNYGRIRKWLVTLVERSRLLPRMDSDVPEGKIGYSRRADGSWTYPGDINDCRQIGKFAAHLFFAIKREEYGPDDREYPVTLFADLNLQAIVCNERYVTYQEYTHDHSGGAHGYYTERLVSYDHVHQQEIDCKYLFKPERMDDVLSILIAEAEKTPRYQQWEPNIRYGVLNRDEEGNETGGFTLPTPGLAEDGLVFSFQPYAISGFAAGTFHFKVPYSQIKHCMTPRGKWCAGLAD